MSEACKNEEICRKSKIPGCLKEKDCPLLKPHKNKGYETKVIEPREEK